MSTVAPKTSPSDSVISFENFLLDNPEGVVILRSQDSYEFRVPKLYIIHASPILRNLLISPNPQPGASLISAGSDVDESTGTAKLANADRVVHLPVTGAILISLLSYIFPVPPILPSTTEQIMELLSVAQTYKMDTVLAHIRNHIGQQQPPFIRKETAFSVYALAQKRGLRAEALQAARCTLSSSTMVIQRLAEDDKLGLMPGTFLHELWKYHQTFRSSLTSGIAEFKASQYGKLISSCTPGTDLDTHRWLSGDNYIVPGNYPDVPTFIGSLNSHLEFGELCEECMHLYDEKVRPFWEALNAVVQGSIAKVRSTHVAASPGGPDRDAQAESDFTVGVEGTRSENEVQAREASFLPKYSDMPSADVILQSSDLVNFRVHRSVLVASSPFFKDMFSLPRPSSVVLAPDGLPVVHLSEAAEVLNSLISRLYPVCPEMPRSVDDILALLAATEKYGMRAVQSSIRAEATICKGLLSPTDSAGVFHLYAVACSKGLLPEMESAARVTLDYPLTFESLGEALRSFDGPALRGLADFRLRCVRILYPQLKSLTDGRNGSSNAWAGCRSFTGRALPLWLEPLFSCLNPRREFAEPVPSSAQFRAKFLEALHDHTNKQFCYFCPMANTLKGEAYCAEVDKVLEQTRNIPFLTLGNVPDV
jgi:hypothetical protein